MPALGIRIIGRFGNQLFQYAFARGYARAHGLELQTDAWIGQRIFDIADPPITLGLPEVSDSYAARVPCHDVVVSGYAQMQCCADYYTKADVLEWFKLKPEIADKLGGLTPEVAFHLRRGDYAKSGYPIVPIESYLKGLNDAGLSAANVSLFSDNLTYRGNLPTDLSFLDDFYAMSRAKYLFRANSSFSWWAGTLGTCEVYSPVIDGIVTNYEDTGIKFTKGNHPRLSAFHFVTNIHLK